MMDDPRALNSDIDEQAALWFSRRQARHLTDEEQRALTAWLRESRDHEQAFQQIQRLWGDCALIPRPTAAPQRSPRTDRWRPLRSVSAGLFLMLVLLLPTSQLPLLVTRDLSLQTMTQSREVVLSDGTRAYLNRNSQMRVHYANNQRQLWLDHGEVYLKVSADRERPFVIYAGESLVQVVGTEFNLRHEANEMVVAVAEGTVAVTGRPQMSSVLLHAGDMARLTPHDRQLKLSQRATAEIGNWRSGHLSFRNRPLGELVAELARYRRGEIVLTDAKLASLPVSGALDLTHPDAFLDSLPLLLPVDVVQDKQGKMLILLRTQ